MHRSSQSLGFDSVFFCCCCCLLGFCFTSDSMSRKARTTADMQFGCSRLRDKSAAVQALEPRWDEEVRSLPLCLAISLARISTFSSLGHSSCAKVSVTRMREAAGRGSGAVGCAGGDSKQLRGDENLPTRQQNKQGASRPPINHCCVTGAIG